MNILIIDTVLNKTYLGIEFNGKKITKTISSDEKNYHSAYLIRTLYDILNCEKISLKDFNYIGVNTGTGSFTGIRVGLSIVKTISNRLNIKTVPYTTFDVLKKAYQTQNIMLDARRGSAFCLINGEIQIIPYNLGIEILKEKNSKFIADNSLINNEAFKPFFNNLISYEKDDINLAEIELEVAKDKIKNKEVYDYYSIKPTYIQTPPVFMK